MQKNRDANLRTNSGAKKEKSKEIMMLTYFFLLIFVALLGYLVFFQVSYGEDMANSPYNRKRQSQLAQKVVRGQIMASEGEVLAKTEIDDEGNETRVYPYGHLFSHVVGYSMNGGSGLEAGYNVRLLRSNAPVLERIDHFLSNSKNIGDNIVTTLDMGLQEAAYNALGDSRGAVVVMNPKTGAVLAMVSKPDYDPNEIGDLWDYYTSEESSGDSSLVNRATQGLYPPGSIFKVFTALAYLREHDDNYEDYQYDCQGSINIEGETINCYHNEVHGPLNLESSFARSCNSSFVNIGYQCNKKTLIDICRGFLFNSRLDIPLAYSKSSISISKATTTYQIMQTVIGQGDTLVTPLHMAMMISTIANDGKMMNPYFVDHIENDGGTVVKQYRPKKLDLLLTSKETKIMKEFMTSVVTEGTASSLNNADYTVAGKTGSAEYGTIKGNSHSWFVCFSPVEDPQIAISVIVEGAGEGSAYAVPVARKILNAYYYEYSSER